MPGALHLVLTRFNLELGFAGPHEPDDPAWLERRWEPFARFCAPSMRAQRAPHRWLVLVHSRTPPAFLRRFTEVGAEPVAMEPPHDPAGLTRVVSEAIGDREVRLITTRLDSDDALHPRALAEVQAAADTPGFVNFPLGCQWSPAGYRWMLDRSNPFISHVEDAGPEAPPQTAYRVAHQWAGRVAPVRQLWRPPRWLQVVHGANEITVREGLRRPLPWKPF